MSYLYNIQRVNPFVLEPIAPKKVDQNLLNHGHTYCHGNCSFVPKDWFNKIAAVAAGDGEYRDENLQETARKNASIIDQIAEERRSRVAEEKTSQFFHCNKADNTTAPDVKVYDAGNRKTLGILTMSSKINMENLSPDEDVRNVNATLTATLEVFKEKFNWNSYNNLGSDILATVHFGKRYDNAEWNGRYAAFGDGDGKVFISFTKDSNIGAHEFGHAITDFNAPEGLNYYWMSGAINEGYSDVFGKITEQWMIYNANLKYGAESARQAALRMGWKVGAATMVDYSNNDDAIRDMKELGNGFRNNPFIGDDEQVDHISRIFTGPEDNRGVHLNSGIFNKAYVLATEAIGCLTWEQTGQCWFQAQKHLSYDCTIQEVANATLAQANLLYKGDNQVYSGIVTGWRAVGIEPKAKT